MLRPLYKGVGFPMHTITTTIEYLTEHNVWQTDMQILNEHGEEVHKVCYWDEALEVAANRWHQRMQMYQRWSKEGSS